MSVAESRPAVPRPKHRWFQFSLWTLLAMTLLTCIVMSWIGLKTRAERERKAKQQEEYAKWEQGSRLIKRIGGSLCPNTSWEKGSAYVCFGRQFSDKGVEQLKGIPEIGELLLANTKVTDQGLAHLRAMTQLKGLDLCGTGVTDVGLENLTGLTALEYLWLDGTKVTEAGVKKLQKALPNCQIEWKPSTPLSHPLSALRGHALDVLQGDVDQSAIEHDTLMNEWESKVQQQRDIERGLLLDERTSEARKVREQKEEQMGPSGWVLPDPQAPPPTSPAR